MPLPSKTCVAALALALAAASFACSDDGGTEPEGDETAEATSISWGECPVEQVDLGDGEVIDVPMEGLECTTVDVPLDYDDPDGEAIELFVSKRPAIADDPIGPLFVNQGGPGASAADYAASIGAYGGLDRFDIIGMDPRGTGRSTHLDCSIEAGEEIPDLATDPDAEPTPYELEIEAVVDTCAQDPRLPHFGTNNTARDMDHIRELLGVEQITYHGKSYGSDLGATYLSLFPEHVRAAVLDGATDLTLEPVDFLVQQTEATKRQLDRYVEHCESEGCAWTGDAEPQQAWEGLLAELEESPIVDEQTGDTFTANDLAGLPMALLETPPDEIDLLLEAMVDDNDVTELIEEVDEDDVDLITAFLAITCLDLPLDDTHAAYARFLESGLFPPSDVLQVLAYCGAWPAADPIVVEDAAESGPVLVVSTRGDVPTPYESGVGLAGALANAELLTLDANLHTGYLNSECVREWADRLLVELEQPPPDTVCDDAPEP